MARFRWMIALVVVLAAAAVFAAVAAPVSEPVERTNPAPGIGDYTAPFWADGVYRDDVRSPSEFLGFEIGARPTRYDEAMAYVRYLAENFPQVSLTPYAHTWEGRELVYLIITSEENAANLQGIKDAVAKLADPRILSGREEAEAIIENTPAVAWLAYSIHGDELSSTDAALWFAYQLVAGEDETTRKIRDQVVVVIDPLQNPDGRERWVKQMESWNGVVTNDDVQSIHHRGMWPYGRGNHYLFDLNRDWISVVHPETRGKVKAVLEWNPQFFTDSHEMSPLDTYLFSPPREPFNPFMIPQIHRWWKIFSQDQGAAFDRYGWSYYTREWNEEVYPGYGSSWSIYIGAIGLLYEQAGVDGSVVKRPDGTAMTYRETVHHQFISSMANVTTVADHREELLRDFYAEKSVAVGGRPGRGREFSRASGAFVFVPTLNRSRLERLVETLNAQEIETATAAEPFTLRRAQSSLGETVSNVKMPAGAVIVSVDQPHHALARTLLAFEVRLPTSFLEIERREVLEKNDTKLYEITAWSLPLAYNLECYYTEDLPWVKLAEPSVAPRGGLTNPSPQFGYVFDGADDRSYALLARLFEKDVEVWCAREPFAVEGKEFPRGSFLVKKSANPKLSSEALKEMATAEGVDVFGVNTALAESGVDLGGNEFRLLERPRIALIAGPGISLSDYGPAWHLLDARLRYPASTLDVSMLSRSDLRKYNVLVLPSTWGGPDVYENMIGKRGAERLKTWIEEGGTLVAIGAGAAFAADTSVALSSVRQRRQVLKKIDEFERAIAYAKTAAAPEVDSVEVWEGAPAEEGEKAAREEKKRADFAVLKEADETSRKLRPRGAILAVDMNEKHWLAFGVRSPVPVLVDTDYTFLTKSNVETAGRFAPPERVRLSGLLWPEARARWSDSAFLTRERRGSGQIILFADTPNFRAYFHGGERLLLNAILLGPGFGADHTFY